jgi:hypothetical protein
MDVMVVRSRTDLANFVNDLAIRLKRDPASWENTTLPAFLDALERYLHDLPGWCQNNEPGIDPEIAEWRLMAVALAGAAVYE